MGHLKPRVDAGIRVSAPLGAGRVEAEPSPQVAIHQVDRGDEGITSARLRHKPPRRAAVEATLSDVTRPRVLFVCTHNSARSQMAEGLLRAIAGDRFEAHSAGTEATFVRPEAITVMGEIGVDISDQASKALTPLLGEPFDWVITVCDQAKESCPVFPGTRATAHWSIDDPAAVTGSEPERLEAFRAARDELRSRVTAFVSRAGSERGHSA